MSCYMDILVTSNSKMSDLKHILRKLEFPGSARDALIRLEKLCFNPSVQHQRLIQEVIEEFVFCEIDRRGIKRKRLSTVQDFQLIEVMLNYLETRDNDVVRNTVFLTLFHCDRTASGKISILAKLVSTAIAIKCGAVLDCSAVWMQQQSCTSEVVILLAQEIVKDYLILYPNALPHLQHLPKISLTFTTHFITALTSTYHLRDGQSNRGGLPQLPLLQCVTSWVKEDSRLCSAPLIVNLQNSLPKGSIVMPARVPILGLIRWTIEAPLEYKKNGDKDRKTFDTLYSQLHLGVLETMIETRMFVDKMIQKDVILMRDLLGVCENLWNIVSTLDFVQYQDNINLSLDRLGQALQVALSTGSLRGNLAELRSCLQKLPNNRLLQMVISQR